MLSKSSLKSIEKMDASNKYQQLISKSASKQTPLSRRSFLKGSVGIAASALTVGGLSLPAHAQWGFREYIPYDAAEDVHYGTRYGVIEHHYPEMNPTGEKFTFVRLKYPGGDWYTNIVNYYRWPSDLMFTEILADKTTIDVEVRENPQYVDIDDEGLFAYPFLYMTGHSGINLSTEQVRKFRDYFERGGFLHVEDCDARLNNYRGGLRPYIYEMVRQIYPEKKLERLEMSHPIYHTLYQHDEYLGGDKRIKGISDYDEAIMDDDRVIIYFCPSDLNCAWEGRPCAPDGEDQRTWAFEQGMNVVAYAMTR